MLEIERKFLVLNNDYLSEASNSTKIVQGFLNSDADRTVRVRIRGEKGFLTVKGRSNRAGTIREEWESEIDIADARRLLEFCEPGLIKKTRFEVKIKNHVFEIDEFEEDNKGLIIAEIELEDENEHFELPNWLGEEVTGQLKYYNSHLSKAPYKNWENEN